MNPSVREERNVNTEHILVAARDELHVQAVRVLLVDDRHWICVEISRELGTAALIVCTILRKELNMRKVFDHWVPPTPTGIGKCQRIETARNAFGAV